MMNMSKWKKWDYMEKDDSSLSPNENNQQGKKERKESS